MKRIRWRNALPGALVVLAVLAAGCGGGGGGDDGGDQTAESPGPVASSGDATGTPTGGEGGVVCETVPQDEIEAVLGGPVTALGGGIQGLGDSCMWSRDDAPNAVVNVGVVDMSDGLAEQTFEGLQNAESGFVPLDGLGDRAFIAQEGTDVQVLRGNELVSVTVQLVDPNGEIAETDQETLVDFARVVLEAV